MEHFTFVMATGIVSTALHNSLALWPAGTVAGRLAETVSLILFWLALAGYFLLLSGVLAGFAGGVTTPRREVTARSTRTLAFVAAGGVIAARMTPLGWHVFALVVIIVSAVAWVSLQYGILAALVVRASTRGRRSLRMFDGTWFLIVVSTQALAVSLGAWSKATGADVGATFAVLFWGLGVLQLILVAALVALRLLAAGVRSGDEVAPYWVFLGAGAISILGAAEVLGTAEEQLVMPRMLVGGVAMALWAFVTWMIPPTIALQVWQRTRRGAIRGYRAALWAMVFPIGMYGESSRELGVMRGTGWLDELGTWEAWVAFAVWLVVFGGLLIATVRRLGGRPVTLG
ncbi:hypothetical protein GOHSU_06_00290 [Gordonia hirsuta DSM 44140 = NBRC 16056]|uniref:TDT family transporter n=1 Tax=Gordonia hirsuta DSM 44140 = NBRC 16056 TaxID=1121927 RepID=L7L8R2_9ACTN|nr:tellurite resistance/C4-dicarboxylate transporter family protein [Gordonia hirsuta]GAC56418.1 hypothetical protein GOHSU_06_00290 [Gordonia hirsuta DSM 44140 = NBRC 16056]